MGNVKWIKITVDMFDDEKIKVIQSMPEGDAMLVIWIKLITLAGKTNDGGYIYIADNIPYTDEMLSVIMNKPLSTIRLSINTFLKLGMIENDTKGIYLLNFEKHQSLDKMEKIKQQNRIRKQRERKRKKLEIPENVTSHEDVTQCHAIDIDIDKEIDKDIDKDIKNNKEIDNNLSCDSDHPALKTKKLNQNITICKEIVSYINELSSMSFKDTTKETQRLINARIKDGFKLDDFKDVIFFKYNQWCKMPYRFKNGVMSNTYFRPSTLFNATNFENYLQEYKENIKDTE